MALPAAGRGSFYMRAISHITVMHYRRPCAGHTEPFFPGGACHPMKGCGAHARENRHPHPRGNVVFMRSHSTLYNDLHFVCLSP